MRCLVCGYVRTRLDPLPETACPECGTDYAVAEQQVAAGLIRPLATPAQRAVRRRDSIQLGAAAIVLLGGAVLALTFLGRNDEMPVSVAHSPQSTAPLATSPQQAQALQATVQEAQPAVVLYTAAWCGVCAKTKRYLARNGIRYTEHDVERSPAAWREYKQYAGDGVPLIVIGGSATRGFNERWLRERLGPWLGGSRS